MKLYFDFYLNRFYAEKNTTFNPESSKNIQNEDQNMRIITES